MDRAMLARRTAPVAVFAAVLGGLLAVSHRGTSSAPAPLPLSNAGRQSETRDTARAGGAVPALAPYGRVTIPDALLAGLPTEGPAYRVESGVDAARVTALARALGIEGTPVRTEGGGWSVGTGDHTLQVSPGAAGSWYVGADKPVAISGGGSVSGVATAVPGTAAPETAPPDTSSSVPPESPSPVPPPTAAQDDPAPCPKPEPNSTVVCATAEPLPIPAPPSPAPQPSDAVARAAADPVLMAAGVTDPTVTFAAGFAGKDVVASPVIDGLPTSGFETRLTVDVHGDVLYGSGYLGVADKRGTYPLLDPRAALDRGYPGVGIEPMRDVAPVPCPTDTPTCIGPYEPPERVATKVRLGLMFAPAFDADDAYLAPAWLLSFAGSDYEEPVLALPDRYLATPSPVPVDKGVPETAIPPDAPVSAR